MYKLTVWRTDSEGATKVTYEGLDSQSLHDIGTKEMEREGYEAHKVEREK
jgi:hypothetical protein